MINSVVLLGRITHDLEPKKTANDESFVKFCVAVQRNYKSKDGDVVTDFIDCAAFGKTADFICKYFGKGSMIALQGSLTVWSWTNPDDNKRIKSVEVRVDNASFCVSAKNKEKASQGNTATANEQDDNLPF